MLFTFPVSYVKMYLVEFGVFTEKCQKSIGKMRIYTDFAKHFFVVFYQPFYLSKPVLV